MAKDLLAWSDVLESIQGRVTHYVSHFSELYGLSPLDLRLRVLLHLPRYSPQELESDRLVREEVERLAAKIQELQRAFINWSRQERIDRLEKAKAYVSEVSEDAAAIVHERFHYIGSVRSGRHFALHFAGQQTPAALVTLSEMDVQKLKAHLPISRGKSTLLLSRMFSFRWAPRNSISYLLGMVGSRLKREGQVESLVTWINPNLGFHASSYRAANWTYRGSEPTVYRYVDGSYLTARQLFHISGATALVVDTSKVRLAPLQIWYYRIS